MAKEDLIAAATQIPNWEENTSFISKVAVHNGFRPLGVSYKACSQECASMESQ